MSLKEAKMLADRLAKGGSTVCTAADRQEAIRLLEKTNCGRKTRGAWDRLKLRLAALRGE